MLFRPALRRHPGSAALLAVLIWLVLGHVCALAELPGAEAAAGSPTLDSSGHGGERHDASCEVTVSAGALKTLVSPASVQPLDVEGGQPAPGFGPLHSFTWRPPNEVLLPRAGRPLFLLFASLLV
jgi:hypothetical protein